MRKLILPLALVCLTENPASGQDKNARSFYHSGVTAPAHLPDDGIFPHGRTMAFMGYSGDPARDLAAGFTVAGPVYGDQLPYLEKCAAEGWPVVAHVGPRVTFKDGDPAKYRPDPPALRAEVARQMADLVSRKNIVWWAIHPEELRPWRADEMLYLETVASAIRDNDPLNRPVFLYNPNHRDAASLTPIARHVDVVGKGAYVNSSGKKRDRAWVRWGIEQELGAIQAAGRKGSIALLMPELCQDPLPEEDKEIPAWVRHDIYLGMASGAQGVNIWSLFKRREVKKTWQIWYDAYSACAKELQGPRGLAQVFLFGQRRSDFTITSSSAAGTIELGGSMEPETSSPQESAKRQVAAPIWTSAEIAYENSRYVFLINSANTSASFTLSAWPAGSVAEDAFSGETQVLPDGEGLSLSLPAYGVKALRFTAAKAAR